MFEKIKECLDQFENIFQKFNKGMDCNDDDIEVLDYFNLNLAKLLMQNGYIDSEQVAKIIFATEKLSDEVVIKVE